MFKTFCDQFNIIALNETWQTKHGDFENFLPGFVNYDCIRTSSAKRGSGGVTFFVKESLSNTNYIHRIYNEWSDCVILFVNRILMGLEKDLILLFTYVSPERSVIYQTGNGNGIDILNNKIMAILSDFPDVAFLLAGDFNARTKNLADYIPSDDVDYIFQCDTAYPCDSFCMPKRQSAKLLW